jgi:hypothetical protein
VGAAAKLLSTDKSKAIDADWRRAEQLFRWDGSLVSPDGSFTVEPLLLGLPDDITGHRVPELIRAGLLRLFGAKVVEHAGLPLSPAVWIRAQVKGAEAPVCVQVFQRAIATYNPANDEANRVQVGLGGAIVQGGLAARIAPSPTATATAVPTATPTPVKPVFDVNTRYGRVSLENRSALQIRSTNDDRIRLLFERTFELTGNTGQRETRFVMLPVGKDLSSQHERNGGIGRYEGRGVVYFIVGAMPPPISAERLAYATVRGSDSTIYIQIDPDDLRVWQLVLSGDYSSNGVNYRDSTRLQFLWSLLKISVQDTQAASEAIRGLVLGPDLSGYMGCAPNSAQGCDWTKFPLDLSFPR